MSSLVDRFMRQLNGRGLSIQGPRDGDPDDRLYLIGPAAEKTPDVMAALKQFKPDLVKRYGRKRLEESAELMREDQPAGE